MNEKQQETTGPASLLAAWMKTATQYWETSARMWPGPAGGPETAAPSEKDAGGRTQESLEAARKGWRTLSSLMGDAAHVESLFKGLPLLPEALLKMVQTGWEGFFSLQQQGLEKAGKIGQSTSAYKFEDLDQGAFKVWNEVYEKEFRQYLNVPQLGLTRLYQEKMSRSIDKFNLFQSALAEFLHVLYLPMEKSFKVLQDEVAEMADEDKLPEDSKEYYRMWIKILEGHYMTLFKTPEYTEAFNRALAAGQDFKMAKREVLEDTLKMYPVPTQKDMDELYKEIYLLKKKIRRLEKKK